MWKGEAKFGQIMDGLLLRFVFFDYLVAGDYLGSYLCPALLSAGLL